MGKNNNNFKWEIGIFLHNQFTTQATFKLIQQAATAGWNGLGRQANSNHATQSSFANLKEK